MSADKNSVAPEAAEGFFSKSKIGVEEWETGFQNVKEILDVYQRDEAKIRQEVTEKHGDVSEGHLLYWQAASRRALGVLRKRWWWAVIVAAVGSIVIDILSDQLSSRFLSVLGDGVKYLWSVLSDLPVIAQIGQLLANLAAFLWAFLSTFGIAAGVCTVLAYFVTSVFCTIIAVVVGYWFVKLLRWIKVIKPETSFDLDEAFVDKEGKAQRRGLERIQNKKKCGRWHRKKS
ncbi:MAG: hypothetical protein LUG44_08790 [Clostridiales bacterium]|nr:hypothetical protein [Clostridiales bacterium]